MTIRRMNLKSDFVQLCRLTRAFFAEYRQHDPEVFDLNEMSEEGINNYFTRFVDRPEAIALVAESDGVVIAYLTAYVVQRADVFRAGLYGDISGLMVDVNFRRRGVASDLMKEAISFFEGRGSKYYTLFTATGNTAAVAFYRGFGMRSIQTTLIGKTTPQRN
jgi:ribosomal protein S18 acetylase RimI-like enzyme